MATCTNPSCPYSLLPHMYNSPHTHRSTPAFPSRACDLQSAKIEFRMQVHSDRVDRTECHSSCTALHTHIATSKQHQADKNISTHKILSVLTEWSELLLQASGSRQTLRHVSYIMGHHEANVAVLKQELQSQIPSVAKQFSETGDFKSYRDDFQDKSTSS